jgi:hypothetical protein
MDEWYNQGITDMNQPIERVIFRTKDKKEQGKDLNLKCTVNIISFFAKIIFICF